ncbi:dihydrodipicolinate synthase family protein [Streptomyces thinghirensis]|nr:dihydrodipicolinate synthase family protein [Streptomyces thinghirensis]
MLEGVLFFPVTPFTATGDVDLDALRRHIAARVDAGPGGVFVACGTGEFHALDHESTAWSYAPPSTAVGGSVPVYAGAGGAVGQARRLVRAPRGRSGRSAAHAAVPGRVPAAGLVAYTREVAGETALH